MENELRSLRRWPPARDRDANDESGELPAVSGAREPPTEVRMDNSRIQVHHQDVRVHRALSETEHVHRNHGRAPQHKNLEEVHPRTSHPIHALRGMMNRVEFPEPRNPMERPMHPVLHEIGEQHDRQELHQPGQGTYPRPDSAKLPSVRIVLAGAKVRNVSTCTMRLLTK